ncbi:MAG: MFS transporter [Liquorilactobacillus ghanensis]|uniref:MFS transporter n=1 Tax=Liquorilactobacillus ghanensis TaxID=399370 RepID=UPI0039ED9045
MFVIGTDTFLVSPLLPTLVKYYGITSSSSGVIVSAYALGYTLSALTVGPISDGHDRRKILIGGLVCFLLSTGACGFANNFISMLGARFFAGVSAAFVGPQVWASIPIVVSKDRIVSSMGFASAGLAVSQIVGIPIGSYLAVFSWRFPFFFISFISLILCIISAWQLPSLSSQTHTTVKFWEIYHELFKNHQALFYLVAYFIFQTGNFCSLSFIGTWFNKSFSLSVGQIGSSMIIIGIGNLLGTICSSKIVDYFGISKAFLIEFVVYLVLYSLVSFSNNIWLAQMMLTLIFLVSGFIFPLFMTTLQETTDTARSTISSISNAAMYLGETLGGAVGGILITRIVGFWGISSFTVTLAAISLGLYWLGGLFKTMERNH